MMLPTAPGTKERGWRLCSHMHFEPGRCHLSERAAGQPLAECGIPAVKVS
jgi:hypothetical protein